MKTARFKKSVQYAVLTAMLLVLLGCKEEKELRAWVETTHKHLLSAQEQSGNIPYRNEQYLAFKTYFSEVGNKALLLKNDANLAEGFNKAVEKSDLQEMCSKVLMPKAAWTAIMSRCRRNGFFLCADEVRAYPDMLMNIRDSLVAEQKKRFDESPACAAAYWF